MKFYIASRFGLKEQVGGIYDKLREKGHEVTTDWTRHAPIKPYADNQDASKRNSMEDIDEGVLESDVFVLISNEAGTGMYVELGAAIAEHIRNGRPKIYVIGEHTGRSMFYFHPSVIRKGSFEEVLEDLESN